MTADLYDRWTKDELIAELRKRDRKAAAALDLKILLQDLEIYKTEIEAQNRHLLEVQDELQEARDAMYYLFEYAPVAYLTIDARGAIREINHRGCQLLGRDGGRVRGKPFLLYVTNGDRHALFRHLLRCRGAPQPVETDVRIQRPERGDEVPAHLSSVSHRLRTGEEVFRTMIFDLRDRIRAEKERQRLVLKEREAEARSEAKDRFLASLSHELRTPLTPVLAALPGLESDPRVPADDRDELAMVIRNIRLEIRLIDDLLDLTRIVRGRVRIERRPIDIHDQIRFAVDSCRESARANGIALCIDLDAARHHVSADPARIQQVLLNLIRNSIKFTARGGYISVRSIDRRPPAGGEGAPGDRVEVSVSDTGIGIEPDRLAKIFSPFEEHGDPAPGRCGGLGLGLAISKGLIEAHGGGLRCASPGPGKGATFAFELAAVAPPPPAPAPAPAAGKTGSPRLRILLVDDHADTLRVLARLLSARGHEIRVAGSVESALLAAARPFDLLISDLGLPDGTGFDLIRKIRESSGPVRAIALSGFGAEEDVRKCRETGFAEHITKPVDFARLLEAIDEVAAIPA